MTKGEPKRELLARYGTESEHAFIRRSCAYQGDDPEPVLSTFSKLVFGGCDVNTAIVEALWVHGLVDTDEDMRIPGAQRHRVECLVDDIELDGDGRKPIPSVEVTCLRCGHSTESYGRSDRSIRRCLVLLREECPNYETNYYYAEGDTDDENYL